MPELGSKISLISKADIRYEGRLFTVDPEECTIALASVRSFGTEERETKFPVPAQTQVYDYILFRGSDIKEIRVIDNVPTLPNDPAIMQLSVPPSLGQQQFHSQGYMHPVLGPMGPPMGQFNTGYAAPSGLAPGGMGLGPRNLPNKQPSELIMSGPVTLPDLSPAVEPLRPTEHDLIGGNSRSTTPASLGSRKSPTADQAVQATGASKKDDKRVTRPIQPPGRNFQRDRRDSRGEQYSGESSRPQNRPPPNRYNQQVQGYQGHPPNQAQRQGGWGQYPRGQPRSKIIRPRGAPGNSSIGNNLNNYRQNQQPPQSTSTTKPKNTLKFDNDYDFEQANTQFEELRSQLEKVKIKENKPEVNGDNEKKDDSGNETGAGEGEQEEEDPIYYDKAKSFFDNISCEAVERSKGRSQRTDWRAERKLNSETFGVSSTRRSGYRGRGGYYNRGGYRPAYRGGYRIQGNQGNNRRMYPDVRPVPVQNQQPAQASNTNSNGQPSVPSVPVSGN